MNTFKGFPPGKVPMVRVPSQFFTEVLGTVDDLDELKLTLYAFWALQQQEGEFRYLLKREVLQDSLLLSGIDPDAERAGQRVSAALERAVQRGTLLHASVEGARGLALVEDHCAAVVVGHLAQTRGDRARTAVEHVPLRFLGGDQIPLPRNHRSCAFGAQDCPELGVVGTSHRR